MKNESPKGKYRLVGTALVGIIFMILVALSGGFDAYGNWYLEKALNPGGWIFKQMNNIGEMCIAMAALYGFHRLLNHFRTHDLMRKIDNISDPRSVAVFIAWIIAIAYVVGQAIR